MNDKYHRPNNIVVPITHLPKKPVKDNVHNSYDEHVVVNINNNYISDTVYDGQVEINDNNGYDSDIYENEEAFIKSRYINYEVMIPISANTVDISTEGQIAASSYSNQKKQDDLHENISVTDDNISESDIDLSFLDEIDVDLIITYLKEVALIENAKYKEKPSESLPLEKENITKNDKKSIKREPKYVPPSKRNKTKTKYKDNNIKNKKHSTKKEPKYVPPSKRNLKRNEKRNLRTNDTRNKTNYTNESVTKLLKDIRQKYEAETKIKRIQLSNVSRQSDSVNNRKTSNTNKTRRHENSAKHTNVNKKTDMLEKEKILEITRNESNYNKNIKQMKNKHLFIKASNTHLPCVYDTVIRTKYREPKDERIVKIVNEKCRNKECNLQRTSNSNYTYSSLDRISSSGKVLKAKESAKQYNKLKEQGFVNIKSHNQVKTLKEKYVLKNVCNTKLILPKDDNLSNQNKIKADNDIVINDSYKNSRNELINILSKITSPKQKTFNSSNQQVQSMPLDKKEITCLKTNEYKETLSEENHRETYVKVLKQESKQPLAQIIPNKSQNKKVCGKDTQHQTNTKSSNINNNNNDTQALVNISNMKDNIIIKENYVKQTVNIKSTVERFEENILPKKKFIKQKEEKCNLLPTQKLNVKLLNKKLNNIDNHNNRSNENDNIQSVLDNKSSITKPNNNNNSQQVFENNTNKTNPNNNSSRQVLENDTNMTKANNNDNSWEVFENKINMTKSNNIDKSREVFENKTNVTKPTNIGNSRQVLENNTNTTKPNNNYNNRQVENKTNVKQKNGNNQSTKQESTIISHNIVQNVKKELETQKKELKLECKSNELVNQLNVKSHNEHLNNKQIVILSEQRSGTSNQKNYIKTSNEEINENRYKINEEKNYISNANQQNTKLEKAGVNDLCSKSRNTNSRDDKNLTLASSENAKTTSSKTISDKDNKKYHKNKGEEIVEIEKGELKMHDKNVDGKNLYINKKTDVLLNTVKSNDVTKSENKIIQKNIELKIHKEEKYVDCKSGTNTSNKSSNEKYKEQTNIKLNMHKVEKPIKTILNVDSKNDTKISSKFSNDKCKEQINNKLNMQEEKPKNTILNVDGKSGTKINNKSSNNKYSNNECQEQTNSKLNMQEEKSTKTILNVDRKSLTKISNYSSNDKCQEQTNTKSNMQEEKSTKTILNVDGNNEAKSSNDKRKEQSNTNLNMQKEEKPTKCILNVDSKSETKVSNKSSNDKQANTELNMRKEDKPTKTILNVDGKNEAKSSNDKRKEQNNTNLNMQEKDKPTKTILNVNSKSETKVSNKSSNDKCKEQANTELNTRKEDKPTKTILNVDGKNEAKSSNDKRKEQSNTNLNMQKKDKPTKIILNVNSKSETKVSNKSSNDKCKEQANTELNTRKEDKPTKIILNVDGKNEAKSSNDKCKEQANTKLNMQKENKLTKTILYMDSKSETKISNKFSNDKYKEQANTILNMQKEDKLTKTLNVDGKIEAKSSNDKCKEQANTELNMRKEDKPTKTILNVDGKNEAKSSNDKRKEQSNTNLNMQKEEKQTKTILNVDSKSETKINNKSSNDKCKEQTNTELNMRKEDKPTKTILNVDGKNEAKSTNDKRKEQSNNNLNMQKEDKPTKSILKVDSKSETNVSNKSSNDKCKEQANIERNMQKEDKPSKTILNVDGKNEAKSSNDNRKEQSNTNLNMQKKGKPTKPILNVDSKSETKISNKSSNYKCKEQANTKLNVDGKNENIISVNFKINTDETQTIDSINAKSDIKTSTLPASKNEINTKKIDSKKPIESKYSKKVLSNNTYSVQNIPYNPLKQSIVSSYFRIAKKLNKHCNTYSSAAQEAMEIHLSGHMGIYCTVSIIHEGWWSRIHKIHMNNTADYLVLKQMRAQFNGYLNKGYEKECFLKDLQESCTFQEKSNLLKVLDGFQFNGTWCYIMDYYPLNLTEALWSERDGGFNILQIIHLSKQLIGAVKTLKRHRIIHSDIQPNHILMNSSLTTLKLCGFDNAHYEEDSKHYMHLAGVKSYRAPELILRTSNSYSIDAWAVACIVFEMTTKRPLFKCTMDTFPQQMSLLFNWNQEIDTEYDKLCKLQNKEYSYKFQGPHSPILQWDVTSYIVKGYKQVHTYTIPHEDKVRLSKLGNIVTKLLVLNPRNRLPIENAFFKVLAIT